MQDKREYNLGRQILRESDTQTTLSVGEKKNTFKVKFPNPLEQEIIERDIAMRLGGVPLDSIPQSSYNSIRMHATLDRIVLEKPDWWEYDSFAECYDEDLVAELWSKYLDARDSFRRSIREGRFPKPST